MFFGWCLYGVVRRPTLRPGSARVVAGSDPARFLRHAEKGHRGQRRRTPVEELAVLPVAPVRVPTGRSVGDLRDTGVVMIGFEGTKGG